MKIMLKSTWIQNNKQKNNTEYRVYACTEIKTIKLNPYCAN